MKASNTELLFEFDKKLSTKFGSLIGGVDEVGRGPLAGPVVCASVIMPLDFMIDGINDSKKVSPKKRKELAEIIKDKAIDYSISYIYEKEIDEINILQATKKCMENSINGLKIKPDIMNVDAVSGLSCNCLTNSIIKGDATSYSIAAASIIAKVERDNYMENLAEEYPNYDFASNKGYGTAKHISALKKFGSTKHHRKSFIKNFGL
ncbi:MAG: ribonuclease HII [Clostridia bacterium]